MGYRVDDIPPRLKPFFYLYGYSVGLGFYLLFVLLHITCRIRLEGKDKVPRGRNYIYCLWHYQWFCYFITFIRHRKHAWMNHPSWYMKPIHVAMRLVGVEKVVLGSTGHGGKEAAEQLGDLLREGYSTSIAPDGPAGPPGTLHKGVLHLSAQAKVPIVPLRFVTPNRWVLRRSWDKKGLPFPFSSITAIFAEPIQVTEENFDRAAARLRAALGPYQ